LEHDHYDLIFNLFGVRNQAKYSAATLRKPLASLHDWELFDRLAQAMAKRKGMTPRPSMPPQTMLDFGLQTGPYGAASEHKLSLDVLKENPQGIDLGPLSPSFPERLKTADQKIAAAPEPMLKAMQEYVLELKSHIYNPEQFVLIGRRHIRSNNSWMHNYERLVKGKPRCTAMLNSQDAQRLKLQDGQTVLVQSRIGCIELPVEITDEVMPGVVSIPHGWGHNREGSQLQVASLHAGVSCNDLTDDTWVDEVSGNAAVNGLPVQVCAV
ncbi:MAG: molybdopterin oxidoreductase family protein, partial [Limnobacter sp.]|nr:molybdopterin oxidoreductase family protein [Limnobacter sp.]